MEKRLFTSESVTEGHPDKICDQVSDAILDALLEQDPFSRVACETCVTTNFVLVMGEVSTKAVVDYCPYHGPAEPALHGGSVPAGRSRYGAAGRLQR